MSQFATGVLSYISARDHQLMLRVHRWQAPRWVRLWMVYATRGGDGWLWYALGAMLALLGGSSGRQAVCEAALAVAAGAALFLWLKRAAGRRRPCSIQPHCWSTLLPPDQFSFPSGHTITAFAAALPVAAYYPDAAPALWFAAASIAISRILLGMHFLSDVVAGALVGALLGGAAHHLPACLRFA